MTLLRNSTGFQSIVKSLLAGFFSKRNRVKNRNPLPAVPTPDAE
jgi:hypothetical protein